MSEASERTLSLTRGLDDLSPASTSDASSSPPSSTSAVSPHSAISPPASFEERLQSLTEKGLQAVPAAALAYKTDAQLSEPLPLAEVKDADAEESEDNTFANTTQDGFVYSGKLTDRQEAAGAASPAHRSIRELSTVCDTVIDSLGDGHREGQAPGPRDPDGAMEAERRKTLQAAEHTRVAHALAADRAAVEDAVAPVAPLRVIDPVTSAEQVLAATHAGSTGTDVDSELSSDAARASRAPIAPSARLPAAPGLSAFAAPAFTTPAVKQHPGRAASAAATAESAAVPGGAASTPAGLNASMFVTGVGAGAGAGAGAGGLPIPPATAPPGHLRQFGARGSGGVTGVTPAALGPLFASPAATTVMDSRATSARLFGTDTSDSEGDDGSESDDEDEGGEEGEESAGWSSPPHYPLVRTATSARQQQLHASALDARARALTVASPSRVALSAVVADAAKAGATALAAATLVAPPSALAPAGAGVGAGPLGPRPPPLDAVVSMQSPVRLRFDALLDAQLTAAVEAGTLAPATAAVLAHPLHPVTGGRPGGTAVTDMSLTNQAFGSGALQPHPLLTAQSSKLAPLALLPPASSSSSFSSTSSSRALSAPPSASISAALAARTEALLARFREKQSELALLRARLTVAEHAQRAERKRSRAVARILQRLVASSSTDAARRETVARAAYRLAAAPGPATQSAAHSTADAVVDPVAETADVRAALRKLERAVAKHAAAVDAITAERTAAAEVEAQVLQAQAHAHTQAQAQAQTQARAAVARPLPVSSPLRAFAPSAPYPSALSSSYPSFSPSQPPAPLAPSATPRLRGLTEAVADFHDLCDQVLTVTAGAERDLAATHSATHLSSPAPSLSARMLHSLAEKVSATVDSAATESAAGEAAVAQSAASPLLLQRSARKVPSAFTAPLPSASPMRQPVFAASPRTPSTPVRASTSSAASALASPSKLALSALQAQVAAVHLTTPVAVPVVSPARTEPAPLPLYASPRSPPAKDKEKRLRALDETLKWEAKYGF